MDTEQQAVILLDVDGVLNAFDHIQNTDFVFDIVNHRSIGDPRLQLNMSTEMAKQLASLPATIKWCTTWCKHDAVSEIEDLLRIRATRALPMNVKMSQSMWPLKVEAVLDHLDAGFTVVWVDDDIAWDSLPKDYRMHPNLLCVSPDPDFGLTALHVDEMSLFLNQKASEP